MSVAVREYQAPAGYEFDVEVLPGARLRAVAKQHPRWIERMNFYVVLYLQRAGYVHMVDFEDHVCAAGTVVTIRPGQVHRFGDLTRLHGYMLMFRSEVLTPLVGRVEFPSAVQLRGSQRKAVEERVRRIAEDTKLASSPGMRALVNAEVHALLLRVAAQAPGELHGRRAERISVERVSAYRRLVESEFARWHTVHLYARRLGCSEKTLARACRDVADMSAKQILSSRIVLEAKRLLAHTSLAVGEVSDELGFSEATNFVKFFRREAGTTPSAFRRHHGA